MGLVYSPTFGWFLWKMYIGKCRQIYHAWMLWLSCLNPPTPVTRAFCNPSVLSQVPRLCYWSNWDLCNPCCARRVEIMWKLQESSFQEYLPGNEPPYWFFFMKGKANKIMTPKWLPKLLCLYSGLAQESIMGSFHTKNCLQAVPVWCGWWPSCFDRREILFGVPFMTLHWTYDTCCLTCGWLNVLSYIHTWIQ